MGVEARTFARDGACWGSRSLTDRGGRAGRWRATPAMTDATRLAGALCLADRCEAGEHDDVAPQLLIPPSRHDGDRAARTQHRDSTDALVTLLLLSHEQSVAS